ncbi:MAG: hypothetical protein FWD37_03345 [Methanomassiliicoccaceae archaeon]|nr:hypothetical protein [Methanomassiliicoccaceae archaeon]
MCIYIFLLCGSCKYLHRTDGPKIAYPMFDYPYYSFISDEIGLISVTLIGATSCGTIGILTPSAVRMRP